MKKMLLAGVLGSALVSSFPAQAHWRLNQKIWTPFGGISVSIPVSGDVVFAVAAAGASAAGIYYIVSRVPSWRLSSAQKTYDSLDVQLVKFLEGIPSGTDLNSISASLYPCSAFPLVTVFNALCGAHKNAKDAIESLESAIWWSKDAAFIDSCKKLQGLFSERLAPFEAAMALVRAQSVWMQQYSLYMQECNNERLARLETAIQFQALSHR